MEYDGFNWLTIISDKLHTMTNTSCMAEQLLISEKDVQAVFYTVYFIIGTAGIVGNIFMIIACTRYVLHTGHTHF